MGRIDPHSYYDTDQPRVRKLELDWTIDFERHLIDGKVVLDLGGPVAGPLDLDSKGLTIHSARNQDGKDVPFALGDEDAILGRRLRLTLPAGTRSLTIAYSTAPDAAALQWLEPVQTAGKRQPFLFSQCQAIHARSIVPMQDSPAVRVPYTAAVTVPEALTVVMSAGPAGTKPGSRPGTRTFRFEMPQPIPSYLLAVAAGDLASRDLSSRARVWAEPSVVDGAAWEFAGVEAMIVKAEGLFGKYEWDRYDMLVLPPSFPYGGMENPRMTFLTPTLLSGDRQLVDVVCHELAHSWTGNLVTNATMDHFWLNEGWTVWAERRILETLHGEQAVSVAWTIGQKSLDESLARFGSDSPLTKLRTDLTGVDPDDAFSTIPYEKGARFVTLLERSVGREKFDRFVRDYIAQFRFTSITTEQFMAFVEAKMPGTAARVNAQEWLHGSGMPANAPVFRSAALDEITALASSWPAGQRPTASQLGRWTPNELLVYLQNLPRELDAASCEWLDRELKLTSRGNYEILVEWLVIALCSDYEPVFAKTREVLMRVGRMKYLRPLYKAMGSKPRTRQLAREIFAAASPTYHSLSRRVVEGLFEKYPA